MTRDPATLKALLARVQGAAGPDPELDGLVAKVAREIPPDAVFMRENAYGQKSDTWYTGGYGAYVYHYPEPYTESIDSALALVERLLPGACWTVENPRPDRVAAVAYVGTLDDAHVGKGATPPLAILAALLTALLAQPEGTETK